MSFVLERSGLDALIRLLSADGYTVYGPSVHDGSLRYRRIERTSDLPVGVRDRQAPGSYELTDRGDDAIFGFVLGASSLKDLFFPPRRPVWTASRSNGSLTFTPADAPDARIAVIGARSCELAALEVHDSVLLGGDHTDPDYAARRNGAFIVTVDCTEPGEMCFCASMGTGPAAESGYDLGLIEMKAGDDWRYMGRVGSERGRRVVDELPHRMADQIELQESRAAVSAAAAAMGRHLDMDGVPSFLAENRQHPGWAEIAERCLACGNCTQACPTCFCVSTLDTQTLDGSVAARETRWDSCFSLDFSFMGGKPVRSSIDGRYRQWLTHKLSSWFDQFGTSGCVGCGRCITWCPVGIDLTVEIPRMREAADA